MSNINDLIDEMKDFAELQAFTEKQYKTILDLNKKNAELQREVEHLKTLLMSANVTIVEGEPSKLASPDDPHEKLICEYQLQRLHQASMERELTAEESKKVETYSKILATFRAQKKPEQKPMQTKSTDELLKLVKND